MKVNFKNKKYAICGALALSLTIGGGVAYAQKANPMDANSDGNISRVEAKAGAETMFDKMDSNKDGKLDASDREAHMAEKRAKRFDAMDTDKNGSISKAEWDASAEKRMERREMRGAGPDGDHGKMGHHGRHGKGGPGKMGGHMGHMGPGMMDMNKDGVVTKDEAVNGALTRFDAADTNKDGVITPTERDAAKAARRAEWKAKGPGNMAPPSPEPAQ